MKTQTNFFAAISQENLNNLTTVVNETLAVHLIEKNSKKLSVADVWNIQRTRRHFVQRRFSL